LYEKYRCSTKGKIVNFEEDIQIGDIVIFSQTN
ncbi:hypothetical protein LCGC14_2663340, partial [marine sediment metagenome]